MRDPSYILNPIQNPIFFPVLERVLVVYLVGFILIVILNKGLKDLWKTNIGKRYLSWLVIGSLYMSAIFFGSDLSLLVLGIVLILAIQEASRISNLPLQYKLGLYILAAITVYIASYQTIYFYSLPLIYFAIISSITIRRNDAKHGLFHSSTSLYILIWLVFSLSHFILLGHLNNNLDNTKSLLLLLGFSIPLSDVGAYVVGNFFRKIRFLDRYKVASNLSPKKTYIGGLGNILGAGIGVWIMYFQLQNYLSYYHWIIISILIGSYGLLGDVTESMFKRYFNVKDSSALIPGHGGILDRIDSSTRVIVVVYYYLRIFLN